MTRISDLLETVQFIPAVVCYLIKQDEVVMIKRKTGAGKNLISGFGGKVGDKPEFVNETPDEAIVREGLEELEITLVSYRPAGRVRFIWLGKPELSMDVTIYIGEEWMGEPCETESAIPVWCYIKALPADQMWGDNPYWIPRVLAGETVDVICVYGADNKLEDIQFN